MSKARWFAILLLVVFFIPSDGASILPVPDADPSPIAVDGLRVVIWEETEDRQQLPREQLEILLSPAWKEFVESHSGQWRLLDASDDPENDLPWVRAAWQRNRDSLPWYQAGNGQTGSEGPLPETVDAWHKILDPLGAKQ